MVERGFDPDNKPRRKRRRGVITLPVPVRISKPYELQPPHPNNPTRILKRAA